MKRFALLAAVFAANLLFAGCGLPREALGFGLGMELGLEQKPRNWSHMKDLAFRKAPRVGDAAPDFTLNVLDGDTPVTLSSFRDGRPLVLIFGSFS